MFLGEWWIPPPFSFPSSRSPSKQVLEIHFDNSIRHDCSRRRVKKERRNEEEEEEKKRVMKKDERQEVDRVIYE